MSEQRPRTIRVDDDLWQAATEKAEREGVSVSEVIRHALTRYAGPLTGTHHSPSSVSIMNGALVLSNEWDEPGVHPSNRFLMQGCKVELHGLDLVVRPSFAPAPSTVPEGTPSAIADCWFQRVGDTPPPAGPPHG